MNVKAAQLRQSILQAAVQGKLVPQDLHDEPASELLQRIQTKKAKLIKEGKIKKEKPLPPIAEDEIPYDLPDGWEWCRLSAVADHRLGKMLDKQKNKGVSRKYLRNQNVQWFHFDLSDMKEMKIEESELEKYTVSKGDLIICEGGYPGMAAIWEDSNQMFFQKALHRVRFFFPNMNYYFLYYLYYSFLSGELSKHYTGSGIQHLTGQSLEVFVFPLPPLAEQKRIVAKVDELMALCDELEAAEKELDALESHFAEFLPKSILQDAVQGKLVPQDLHDEPASELLRRIQAKKAKLVKEGKIRKEKPLPPITEDEIPYDLPDGWAWCRLGDAVQLINGDRGKNYPSKDKLSQDGIPFISAVNINDFQISSDKLLCLTQEQYDVLGSGKLQKNDIVFCIRGSLGKCGIFQYDAGAIASSLVILRPFSGTHMVLGYLMFYLRTPLLFSEMQDYDNGTAQPNLSAGNLKMFAFPLPPLAEQKRIVAKVDELLALCEELKTAKDVPAPPLVLAAKPRSKKKAKKADPIGMAARGKVASKPSAKLQQVIDDLFDEDE